MIRLSRMLMGACALALAGCGSAPVHYYTLVPPASPVSTSMAAPLSFELAPVGIPSQVDQPQLVVRQDATGVAMLDGERWIAPLADELRAALSADLAHQLGGQDVSSLPHGSQPVTRIRVDLRRFDSLPGRYALIDATWSVRSAQAGDGVVPLACATQVRQPVGPGYQALVQGHQQALAELSRKIAATVRGGSCP